MDNEETASYLKASFSGFFSPDIITRSANKPPIPLKFHVRFRSFLEQDCRHGHLNCPIFNEGVLWIKHEFIINSEAGFGGLVLRLVLF